MNKLFIVLCFIFLFPNLNIASDPVVVNDLLDAIALSDESEKDVLVIFTADWCKYCGIMKNDLKELSKELDNKIICYVDIDKDQDLKKEYSVDLIPDYFILRKRIEINRKKGYRNKQQFIQWLNKND